MKAKAVLKGSGLIDATLYNTEMVTTGGLKIEGDYRESDGTALEVELKDASHL